VPGGGVGVAVAVAGLGDELAVADEVVIVLDAEGNALGELGLELAEKVGETVVDVDDALGLGVHVPPIVDPPAPVGEASAVFFRRPGGTGFGSA
jgi:hypothetical protein